MNVLGFIPARGGSKGIRDKNIVNLCGNPLIQYTIEAALQSTQLQHVFLSTDSQAIKDVARGLGVETSYVRPPELADDCTAMVDTVLHGLDWLNSEQQVKPDAVMLLQPTSPLRSATDIDEAIAQFIHNGTESLVSVNRMHEHPCECLHRNSDGSWQYLAERNAMIAARQHYDNEYYFINGAIYLISANSLKTSRLLVLPNAELYVMPAERSIDIDELPDLRFAEAVLSAPDASRGLRTAVTCGGRHDVANGQQQ